MSHEPPSSGWNQPPVPPPAPSSPVESTAFRCLSCGYDISGTALGGSCPECGSPVAATLQAVSPLKPHPKAVTALVLGLLSLLVCMVLGPFAVYCGHRVRVDVDAGLYSRESRGMGTAGFVCGIIATIILALYAVLLPLQLLD